VPEEINRRIADNISDVHLPYTENARLYLLAEGIRGEYVFVIGSPMAEVIAANKIKIDASDILERLRVNAKKYFILSAHREENIDNFDVFSNLMSTVNTLAETYQMPIIYSVHPRSEKFIKERTVKFHPLVREMPPFPFTDYSRLMQNAYCVLSDSGTLAEEASINRFPAVSIRTSTERPEALDKGVIVLGGVTNETVLQSVELAVNMSGEPMETVPDYNTPNVSDRVIQLIQGYTPVINKNVWRKML
jgi:UDP-N-acetylglucosamine 2-epimerase (non-hydrolysing)